MLGCKQEKDKNYERTVMLVWRTRSRSISLSPPVMLSLRSILSPLNDLLCPDKMLRKLNMTGLAALAALRQHIHDFAQAAGAGFGLFGAFQPAHVLALVGVGQFGKVGRGFGVGS